MKGKIILGIVVVLGVAFDAAVFKEVVEQLDERLHPPQGEAEEIHMGDLSIDLVLVNNQMRFYERDEGLFVVDYRGIIDVDDIDVRGLYETLKRRKLEIGDGYVFVPTYVDYEPHESAARVYANDLMFRSMGGPEGSMDTSPNPALSAPGDD